MIVKEIITKEEMLAQFPLLLQLNPSLEKEQYTVMLDDMLRCGYRMAGVFENDRCIGLSGFWIATKIYCGKYLEPDNVVIDASVRSKGVGKLLCDWLENLAREAGCQTLMLDAYLENEKAHRFYEREGYFKRGYHFLKKL